jgi:hypothetical protein
LEKQDAVTGKNKFVQLTPSAATAAFLIEDDGEEGNWPGLTDLIPERPEIFPQMRSVFRYAGMPAKCDVAK